MSGAERTDDLSAPSADADAGAPAIARIYDTWLGGNEGTDADRAVAERMAKMVPTIRAAALDNRKFLRRVVRYLAADQQIDQFLDIGSGFPTADNVHEVAQRVNPAARVVYVDNDLDVVARSREILAGNHVTAVAHGDLRDPDALLNDAVVQETLDFGRPIAVLLLAILHFVTDESDAYGAVAKLTGAISPGSFLVISHIVGGAKKAGSQLYESNVAPFALRTTDEVGRFFDGLDVESPGLVPVSQWRPELGPDETHETVPLVGATARKTLFVPLACCECSEII